MQYISRKGTTELYTSLVVALVALVGLVVVYSETTGSLSGAAQTMNSEAWGKVEEAGILCGACSRAAMANLPLLSECSKATPQGPLYQIGENRAQLHCCERACLSSPSEHCQSECNGAASDPTRYGKNPFTSS